MAFDFGSRLPVECFSGFNAWFALERGAVGQADGNVFWPGFDFFALRGGSEWKVGRSVLFFYEGDLGNSEFFVIRTRTMVVAAWKWPTVKGR